MTPSFGLRFQTAIASAPKTFATVRTVALNVVRLAGYSNGAEAMRQYAWHPKEVLAWLGIPVA
jgi:hypothetical protein